jgi:hypothetical protein
MIRDGNEIVLNHSALEAGCLPCLARLTRRSLPEASEMRGLKSVGDGGGESWPWPAQTDRAWGGPLPVTGRLAGVASHLEPSLCARRTGYTLTAHDAQGGPEDPFASDHSQTG